MSLFDYPRINVKGNITFSPATANNDDFAQNTTLPDNWGSFAGQPLALVDSKNVEARTYGMSDEAFIKWAQKAQKFEVQTPSGKSIQEIIPAEWNYYGALNFYTTSGNELDVTGVQYDPDKSAKRKSKSKKPSPFLGAKLKISGHFADINSQGSPPATQFFIDNLTLSNDSETLINSAASKAASLWLNFYRNVNLTADAGAGAYAYHVIKKSKNSSIFNHPEFNDPDIVGLVFRYYLYRPLVGGTASRQSNKEMEEKYKCKEINPAKIEIMGTFAPLRKEEKIYSMPTGRLMVSNIANIKSPEGTHNNSPNGKIALAPAVLSVKKDKISVDLSGTFPDYFQKDGSNPKYDFGPVALRISSGRAVATIGTIDYADTAAGDAKGWIFDFDVSAKRRVISVLRKRNATFQLVHPKLGVVLAETEYYFVSNQLGIYTEQHGLNALFLNQGFYEPATVSVFRYGRELPARACPPITLWQYRSIPLEAPGDAVAIDNNFKPGQPIEVDTSQPGNYLFTFSINTPSNKAPAGYPPKSYNDFANPPFITNAPSVSLRILPNGEDFSRYYLNPNSPEPVGNANLTFDVVFRNVLRTYYLLYPAMNQIFDLSNEEDVTKFAPAILQRTSPAIWMSSGFMPRTRTCPKAEGHYYRPGVGK